MPPFLYFFLSRRQNIKIVHRRPGRVARLVAPDPRLAGAKQLADARADGAGERRRRVAEGLEGCPARAHRAARQHAPLQALGLGRAVQSAAWMLSVRDPQHAVAMGHALLAGPACALSAASAHTRCSQAPLPLEVPCSRRFVVGVIGCRSDAVASQRWTAGGRPMCLYTQGAAQRLSVQALVRAGRKRPGRLACCTASVAAGGQMGVAREAARSRPSKGSSSARAGTHAARPAWPQEATRASREERLAPVPGNPDPSLPGCLAGAASAPAPSAMTPRARPGSGSWSWKP